MNMGSSFLPLLLGLLSCLSFSIAGAGNQTIPDPTGMLNLSKFQAYTNALLCLLNTSGVTFPAGGALTEKGLHYVNGTAPEVTDYCQKGPVSQLMVQLHCMQLVLIDFRFNDNAQLSDINSTLIAGCNSSATSFGKFNSTLYVTSKGVSSSAILNLGTVLITVVVAIASFV